METKELEPLPLFEERPWAKDALHVTTTMHFDLRDRLNILMTGFFEVRQTTYCENRPGKSETDDVRLRTTGLPALWRGWRNRNKPMFGVAEAPRSLPTMVCDVIGCDSPATCRVGCGTGHPSCDHHAGGADYVQQL